MPSHLPRVLFVAPATAAGPTTVFIRNDIAGVEKLGVQGRTFILASRTSVPTLIRDAGLFRRMVKEFRPDLIHAHYGTVTALFCALFARQPLVITFQGSDLNPFYHANPLRSPVGRLFSHLAALRASGIICVSRQLKNRLYWNRTKARIIPSGVDTSIFRPIPKAHARSMVGWGPHEKVVISSAGTDPPRKRLDLAQAGVRVAETICGKIRLVVLDGKTEHNHVAILFNAADCFVMTSDWEGSPNVVKESLACGLPVVSVDVGDVAERLHGVWPSQIVRRDPQDIGKALADILLKGERSNGPQTVEPVSIENTARAIIDVYRDALAYSRS